jgi:hypothetical protein
LQLPRMGYVDREQFSALASGPHKFPGRLYPFPRIRRWRLDFTPYILTLVLHSSLWRRERDRHASHFYWLLCLSSREADQERGVCSLAVFAPSTLSQTHTFARISPSQKPSSSRSLSLFVDSSSTGMCSFVFCFFVRLLLIPFSLLLVAFGLGYGRFLCICCSGLVFLFLLSIGQEQEMKWKSVFRFRNDFFHSLFFCSFRFVKKCVDFFWSRRIWQGCQWRPRWFQVPASLARCGGAVILGEVCNPCMLLV